MASKPEDLKLNIVAELYDARNRETAIEISPEEIVTVDALDILAKILGQTSRSIGLSVVYSEIVSFAGCEMYFYSADWGGLDFGRIQFRFPDGVPMGIRRPGGDLLIVPPLIPKWARETTFSSSPRTIRPSSSGAAAFGGIRKPGRHPNRWDRRSSR